MKKAKLIKIAERTPSYLGTIINLSTSWTEDADMNFEMLLIICSILMLSICSGSETIGWSWVPCKQTRLASLWHAALWKVFVLRDCKENGVKLDTLIRTLYVWREQILNDALNTWLNCNYLILCIKITFSSNNHVSGEDEVSRGSTPPGWIFFV